MSAESRRPNCILQGQRQNNDARLRADVTTAVDIAVKLAVGDLQLHCVQVHATRLDVGIALELYATISLRDPAAIVPFVDRMSGIESSNERRAGDRSLGHC
jgi:hypothetical protein